MTNWSRYPLITPLTVSDPRRTVAALVRAPIGPLIVVGTVFPWATDRGDAEPGAQVRNWSELHRIVPEQGAEWSALRRRHPKAALCVAGDLNMNLGGKHFYGTAQARSLLGEAMDRAGLFCATSADRMPEGALQHPPIDHVLLPVEWRSHTKVAAAWEGKTGSEPKLSDHGGLAVSIDLPVQSAPQDGSWIARAASIPASKDFAGQWRSTRRMHPRERFFEHIGRCDEWKMGLP